jgi:hypothetical protein
MNGSTVDDLSVELWYQPSTPLPPQNVTIDATTTYQNCDYCILIYENFDPSTFSAQTYYLARSGSLTVTKGDQDPGMGQMQVSGSNLHFLEWDLMNDTAVKNGGCYDVSSMSMSGTYSNADGGTDM